MAFGPTQRYYEPEFTNWNFLRWLALKRAGRAIGHRITATFSTCVELVPVTSAHMSDELLVSATTVGSSDIWMIYIYTYGYFNVQVTEESLTGVLSGRIRGGSAA